MGGGGEWGEAEIGTPVYFNIPMFGGGCQGGMRTLTGCSSCRAFRPFCARESVAGIAYRTYLYRNT